MLVLMNSSFSTIQSLSGCCGQYNDETKESSHPLSGHFRTRVQSKMKRHLELVPLCGLSNLCSAARATMQQNNHLIR